MKASFNRIKFLGAYIIMTIIAASIIRFALVESLDKIQEVIIASSNTL